MYRTSRSVITALLILLVIAFQIGTSAADPGRGKGREGAPAHGRDDAEGEEDAPEEDTSSEETSSEETSSEETSSEDETSAEEESSTEESSSQEPSSEEAEGERPQRGASDQRSAQGSSGSEPGNGRTNSNTAAGAQADVVDVSFSASPASLELGETSTLTVVASNPGTDAVDEIGLLVELPPHLDLVSSVPAGSTSGRLLSLDLGGLAPGATSQASVTVAASSAPPGVQEPVRFAVSVDGDVVRHQLFVEVATPAGDELSLSQTSPLLVQVGETSAFSVTVANQTEAPLDNVAVVTEIAPELDVVGVTPVTEADAVQVGASPVREDIVWIFDRLAAGEAVQLSWTGRAVAPGDLEAQNVVDAIVGGTPVASNTQNTYLGYVLGVRSERGEEAAPVVEQRTVTKMVPVTVEVAGSVGAVLPVTGAPAGALVAIALVLIGLGALFVAGSRGSRASRRALVVAVAALMLTGAACVSDGGGSADTASDADSPAASPSATPDAGSPKDPKDKDQVLGLRLNRKDPRGGAGVTPDAPDGSSDQVPPTTTEVVYEEVTSVVSVVVPADELPTETMQTSPGDNTISLTWTGAVDTVTSGRVLTQDMTHEILASLRNDGDRFTSTVSLANLAEDRRLVVRGRLVLDIVAEDRRSSRLTSGPIDVVLEPGGLTAADLSFSLPPGTYSLSGGFVTD